MSDVSLRAKAYALIECSLRVSCKHCVWNNKVCEAIEHGQSEGVKREVIQCLLGEIDKLEEENAVLKERIAIMEVDGTCDKPAEGLHKSGYGGTGRRGRAGADGDRGGRR